MSCSSNVHTNIRVLQQQYQEGPQEESIFLKNNQALISAIFSDISQHADLSEFDTTEKKIIGQLCKSIIVLNELSAQNPNLMKQIEKSASLFEQIVPQKEPLDIHEAIILIRKHYETKGGFPEDPPTSRAIQSVFTHMGFFTFSKLSTEEKETLSNLYENIATMDCAQHPTWIRELQKYNDAQSSDWLSLDPLLQTWENTQANTPEHRAYTRIKGHLEQGGRPRLDLSNLGLTKLPACLFRDPIFANTIISGNKCAKFPEGLPIGFICNNALFEQILEQIEKSPSNKVFNNPELTGTALFPLLNLKDSTKMTSTSRSFNEGTTLSSRERLENYKNKYYNYLPPGIQTKLDNLKILSKEDCKALDIEIDKLEKDIIQQQLQDESLIKALPAILISIEKRLISQEEDQHAPPFMRPAFESMQQAFQAIPQSISAKEKAKIIRSLLKANQETLAEVITLHLTSLELSVIPSEIKLFTTLAVLFLQKNKISDISIFHDFPHLHHLNLRHNEISKPKQAKKILREKFPSSRIYTHSQKKTSTKTYSSVSSMRDLTS